MHYTDLYSLPDIELSDEYEKVIDERNKINDKIDAMDIINVFRYFMLCSNTALRSHKYEYKVSINSDRVFNELYNMISSDKFLKDTNSRSDYSNGTFNYNNIYLLLNNDSILKLSLVDEIPDEEVRYPNTHVYIIKCQFYRSYSGNLTLLYNKNNSIIYEFGKVTQLIHYLDLDDSYSKFSGKELKDVIGVLDVNSLIASIENKYELSPGYTRERI